MRTPNVCAAFAGSPDVKQLALEQLGRNRATDTRHQGLTHPDEFAESHHLAPSYCHLLGKLDGRPFSTAASPFADTALNALTPGTPTSFLAWEWLEWVYRDSSAGITSVLSNAAKTASDEIMLLYRRQKQGESVNRAQWRSIRQTLSTIRQQEANAAGLLEIVGAMAWDLTATPGAVADVLIAWENKIRSDVDAQLGWTSAVQEEFIKIHSSHVQRACLNLGIEQSELHTADRNQFTAEVERLWDESDSKHLLTLAEKRSESQRQAVNTWCEEIKDSFMILQKAAEASHELQRF